MIGSCDTILSIWDITDTNNRLADGSKAIAGRPCDHMAGRAADPWQVSRKTFHKNSRIEGKTPSVASPEPAHSQRRQQRLSPVMLAAIIRYPAMSAASCAACPSRLVRAGFCRLRSPALPAVACDRLLRALSLSASDRQRRQVSLSF